MTETDDDRSLLLFGKDLRLPAPIKKRLLKVLYRLGIGGPIDRKEAKKWATNHQTMRIVEGVEAKIAENVDLPPGQVNYVVDKSVYRIVKEQSNLNTIAAITVGVLNDLPPKKEQSESEQEDPINDGFFDVFESFARIHSTQDMQLMFARILAGEIAQPGSFSTKTLFVAAQLEQTVASMFQHLCSMSCALTAEGNTSFLDVRLPSLGMNLGTNELSEYGINIGQLTTLQDYGLITPSYDSSVDYGLCVFGSDSPAEIHLSHRGKDYWLVSTMQFNPADLKVDGVEFSVVGKELFSIVEQQHTDTAARYSEQLRLFFRSKNLRMVEKPKRA